MIVSILQLIRFVTCKPVHSRAIETRKSGLLKAVIPSC